MALIASKTRKLRKLEMRTEDGGWLEPSELEQRANDAARKVMRGMHWADRQECASHIIAVGVAAMPCPTDGRRDAKSRRNPNVSAYHRALAAEQRELSPRLYVRRNDPRHSFTAYEHRALHFRRDLIKQREREAATDADALAKLRLAKRASGKSLLPRGEAPADDGADELAPHEYGANLADVGCWRLSHSPHSAVDGRAYGAVWATLYSAARDVPSAVAANDLGVQGSTLRKRVERGSAALAARHATAADLLAALLDGAAINDASAAAQAPTLHSCGWSMREPRTSGPDAPIILRKLRGGRRKARPMSDEQRAASMRKLAAAQSAAMRSTLPTKPLATKSGHAGETGIRN